MLHKLWFMWGDFVSVLVHHLLQINLIETKNEKLNEYLNSQNIKPECAAERVDDNLWNIIFT